MFFFCIMFLYTNNSKYSVRFQKKKSSAISTFMREFLYNKTFVKFVILIHRKLHRRRTYLKVFRSLLSGTAKNKYFRISKKKA